MVKENVIVTSPSGLHMRPANILAQLASQCSSSITITAGDKVVNPKSLLMLMAAAIPCGAEVTVTCEGAEEEKDLKTIIEAIKSGLGELQ